MNTSIFIRTCKKDIEWIPYCLAAIKKYCTGFADVTLVIPARDQACAAGLGARVAPAPQYPGTSPATGLPNDHIGQVVDKLEATKYVSGDFIVFIDSDVLVTRPISPQDLMLGSRPCIYKAPYTHPAMIHARHWKAATEKVMGEPVEYEYMRRFPFAYWRDTITNFQRWFIPRHGSIKKFVFAQRGGFSEFNVLGAWVDKYEHDKYAFLDTTKDVLTPDCVRQFWSWDGTSKVKAELEAIIK